MRERRHRDLELIPERKRRLILEIVEGSWNEHPTHKRNTQPCTPCLKWMRYKGFGEYSTGNGSLKPSAKLRVPWIPGGWAVGGALRRALKHLTGGPDHLKNRYVGHREECTGSTNVQY